MKLGWQKYTGQTFDFETVFVLVLVYQIILEFICYIYLPLKVWKQFGGQIGGESVNKNFSQMNSNFACVFTYFAFKSFYILCIQTILKFHKSAE